MLALSTLVLNQYCWETPKNLSSTASTHWGNSRVTQPLQSVYVGGVQCEDFMATNQGWQLGLHSVMILSAPAGAARADRGACRLISSARSTNRPGWALLVFPLTSWPR